MKSVMIHDFSRLPTSNINVSTFNLSHGVKTAFDSGNVIPIGVFEVLPGDTLEWTSTGLAKMLSPMVSSPMDNMKLTIMAVHAPSRILWNNFTKMMGERINPSDSIDYSVPTIDSGDNGFEVGSLADYLGIPTGVPHLKVNALPFRMYQKVRDDWFRHGQLQDSVIQHYEDLGDGNPNNIEWNKLFRRCKRPDYFNTCLPRPQLGEGVELPLGDWAPVVVRNEVADKGSSGVSLQWSNAINGSLLTGPGNYPTHIAIPNGVQYTHGYVEVNDTRQDVGVVKPRNLWTDLSGATASTINSLRMAFQIQRMLELDSRATGSRIIEIIKAHFNTVCPDARLQRSEYLGGSTQLININEIQQFSATDAVSPQGNRAANASTITQLHFKKSFTEWGYVMVLAQITADINYQHGLNRMWSRKGRYDFYWPALAHLGEQPVLNKEIFAQGNEDDDKPFGYQERFAEYRYQPSLITGKLRSTAPGSLDIWHLAPHYTELPTLSPEFIEDNPPIKRVLAIQDEPEFILDVFHAVKATRPLPIYSTPGLIDHA